MCRWQRACCGLDDNVNPYSLRHTIGRYLRMKSVPPWEVAAQLGHKRADVATTEIYAPFDPAYLDKAVAAIDELLKEILISPDEKPLTLPKHCQPNSDETAKSLKNMAPLGKLYPNPRKRQNTYFPYT